MLMEVFGLEMIASGGGTRGTLVGCGLSGDLMEVWQMRAAIGKLHVTYRLS